METKAIKFIQVLKSLIDSGKSLKEINKWSYEQREAGMDIPYMMFGQKSKDPSTEYLIPAPIKKQNDWYTMFSKPDPNFINLPTYALYVYFDKISFQKRSMVDGKPVKYDLLHIPNKF